ncbi:MAG: hypothetical protein MZV63_28040 [Marinilabiliales bacterium]|nr:hypothetical protein [Marinilabiliales bacterium]
MLSMLQAASAEDFTVTGTVSDESGALVMNANVSFFLNTREYRVLTGTDGRYSVNITGLYSDVAGQFQTGIPYPNPFNNSVNIPFVINIAGDVMLNIYNLAGEKVRVMVFPEVVPGSYNVVWDGCGQQQCADERRTVHLCPHLQGKDLQRQAGKGNRRFFNLNRQRA